MFLAVLALGLMSTRGLDTGDAAVHLDVALGWLARGGGALSIDPGAHWVPTEPRAGGLFHLDGETLRSASAPGLAALAVPPVAVGSLLSDGEPLGLSAFFARAPSPSAIAALQRDPRVIAFTLLGPLAAATTVAVFWFALGALGTGRRARGLATLALAVGSPLLAYAGSLWTQLPATAGLALALLATVRALEAPSRRLALGTGAALSFAVLVRPDHGLLAAPFVAAWAHRARAAPSRMIALLAPLGLVVAGLFALDVPLGGDGWDPTRWPRGAAGLLASPRTGLLFFAPFVALAPLGVRRLAPALRWVALGVPALALALYGGWFDWGASLAYGPRFLLPALPPLALAFAAAVDRPRAGPAARGDVDRLGAVLVGLGLLVQLPGALVHHARIDEPARSFHLTARSAWRTLLAQGPEVVALEVSFWPMATALVAGLGFALARRGNGRARPTG